MNIEPPWNFNSNNYWTPMSIVCLFVWSLSSHSRIFHSYGDVSITGEGLQILTYSRHLWPLSSECSLVCHTYCDTGFPFIMVISEEPWYSHLLPSVLQWSCHYLFLRVRSVEAGIRTPNLPLAGANALTHRPPPRSLWTLIFHLRYIISIFLNPTDVSSIIEPPWWLSW